MITTDLKRYIFFQFKLLHRRLTTNDFLNKIGIRPDDLCTFCRDERESLIHGFSGLVWRPMFSGKTFRIG